MKKIILIIAGTSVTIETDEAIAFFLNPLRDLFHGFLKQRGPAAVALTISYNHLVTHRKFPPFPIPLSRKKDRESESVLRQVEKLYPLSDATLLIGFLNGLLAYNVHSGQGHVCLFRSTGKNFIAGSLHKLIFLYLALIMAEQGKLMIHGAGLRIESEGRLFPGASGAGKSTIAGYVERGSVLSDDTPVITKKDGLFTIHASPFSQIDLFESKAANHHRKEASLTRILFLNQAAQMDLKPRDKRSALAELLREHIHGFNLMDRDLKIKAFHFCCEMCATVPAFDLYFQNNNQFLSLMGDQIPLNSGYRLSPV